MHINLYAHVFVCKRWRWETIENKEEDISLGVLLMEDNSVQRKADPTCGGTGEWHRVEPAQQSRTKAVCKAACLGKEKPLSTADGTQRKESCLLVHVSVTPNLLRLQNRPGAGVTSAAQGVPTANEASKPELIFGYRSGSIPLRSALRHISHCTWQRVTNSHRQPYRTKECVSAETVIFYFFLNTVDIPKEDLRKKNISTRSYWCKFKSDTVDLFSSFCTCLISSAGGRSVFSRRRTRVKQHYLDSEGPNHVYFENWRQYLHNSLHNWILPTCVSMLEMSPSILGSLWGSGMLGNKCVAISRSMTQNVRGKEKWWRSGTLFRSTFINENNKTIATRW